MKVNIMDVNDLIIVLFIIILIGDACVVVWISYRKEFRHGYKTCYKDLIKTKNICRRRKKKCNVSDDISDKIKPTESETVRIVATRPGDRGFWNNR